MHGDDTRAATAFRNGKQTSTARRREASEATARRRLADRPWIAAPRRVMSRDARHGVSKSNALFSSSQFSAV